MSENNILYNINGKIYPITSSYYNIASDILYIKNIETNNLYINLPDGILLSNNKIISSLSGVDNQVLAYDGNNWVFQNVQTIDISSSNISITSSSDISGLYNAPYVRNLSNVSYGVLQVKNGGTGLSESDFTYSGMSLLLGNLEQKLNIFNAISSSYPMVLSGSNNSWSFFQQTPLNSASVNVQIYTTPGIYTWEKPAGTTSALFIVHGGGGGGGSGGNRSTTTVACQSGGGGASGACSYRHLLLEQEFLKTAIVTVGSGGIGANYPSTNSSGIAGGSGMASSVQSGSINILTCNGGGGGNGGLVNSSTVTIGGVSGVVSQNIVDLFSTPFYSFSNNGSNGTTTFGVNNSFNLSNLSIKASGGGGSGASLLANSSVQYSGGGGGANVINNGTASSINGANAVTSSIQLHEYVISNIPLASGGGGGASPNGKGGDGLYGSGGGGGAASNNFSPITKQGGNGGDGYVIIISYLLN